MIATIWNESHLSSYCYHMYHVKEPTIFDLDDDSFGVYHLVVNELFGDEFLCPSILDFVFFFSENTQCSFANFIDVEAKNKKEKIN